MFSYSKLCFENKVYMAINFVIELFINNFQNEV